MKVLVFNQQNDLSIATQSVKPIVQEVLSLEKRKTDEVAVHFVSQEYIASLHEEFFEDPSPTDCISFPIDGTESISYHVLGEIFICPKVAIDYVLCSITKVEQEEFYKETTLYLVHGLLHLIGYDDIKEADRKRMRTHEKRCMQHLLNLERLLFGV